jgi:hypothetical protein
MVELLRAIERLFAKHAPETLMAFFGAGTSILLFYLVWAVLQHMFGLQRCAAAQEDEQDDTLAALIEALVTALVTEAGHLRQTVDGVLREAIRYGQHNADLLEGLTSRAEEAPHEVMELLKPEFEYLYHEMSQVEQRIVDKVTDIALHLSSGVETHDTAAEQAIGGEDDPVTLPATTHTKS